MVWASKALRLGRATLHVGHTRLAEIVGTAPPGPMMVFWEVTRLCNLRCRQCDVWQTEQLDPAMIANELPSATILGVLAEMRTMGLVAVDFFGGEPLLRRDLADLVAGAKALGLHVTVTTNAWLLDTARARELAHAGVAHVIVSLDGSTAALHDSLRGRKGAYARARAGIAALAAYPSVHRGVNVVLNRLNAPDLLPFVDLAGQLKLDSFRILPYHACWPFQRFSAADDDLRFGSDDIARLAWVLPRAHERLNAFGIATNARAYYEGIIPFVGGHMGHRRCSAGSLVCDVIADGSLITCAPLPHSAGNVCDRPFRELWRSQVLASHRQRLHGQGCDVCWQGCYHEPHLRTRPLAALRDLPGLLSDVRRFILGTTRRTRRE